MGRYKAIEKKTTLSINEGLSGWLEFRGRDYPRKVSEYLCQLAEEDRGRARTDNPEMWERYLAFLSATNRSGELGNVTE